MAKAFETGELALSAVVVTPGAFVVFSVMAYMQSQDALGWFIAFALVVGVVLVPVVWLVIFWAFMIATSIANSSGRRRDFVIACAALGGFAALLARGMFGTWSGLLYVPYMLLAASIMVWNSRHRPMSVSEDESRGGAEESIGSRSKQWTALVNRLNALGFSKMEIERDLIDRGVSEMDAGIVIEHILSKRI